MGKRSRQKARFPFFADCLGLMPRRLLDVDGFHDRRNLDDMSRSRNAVSRNLNSSTHIPSPFLVRDAPALMASRLVLGQGRPSLLLRRGCRRRPCQSCRRLRQARPMMYGHCVTPPSPRKIITAAPSRRKTMVPQLHSFKCGFRFCFLHDLYYTVSSASNAKRRTNEKAERSEPHQISQRT